MDTTTLIDGALRLELKAAGALDVDVLLPAVKRDGVAYDTSASAVRGAREAVAALKTAKPALFQAEEKRYLAPGKSIEQIEREMDVEHRRKRPGQWL